MRNFVTWVWLILQLSWTLTYFSWCHSSWQTMLVSWDYWFSLIYLTVTCLYIQFVIYLFGHFMSPLILFIGMYSNIYYDIFVTLRLMDFFSLLSLFWLFKLILMLIELVIKLIVKSTIDWCILMNDSLIFYKNKKKMLLITLLLKLNIMLWYLL